MTASAASSGYVNTNSANLNLRSSPSTNSAILAKMPKGSSVTVLNNEGNGWYRISYKGITGYASSRYIAVNNTQTSSKSLTDEQVDAICFDAVYYANRYPDLKAAFGYDFNKLYNHWVGWGQREGRSASPIFDPKYYLEANPDVANAYGQNNYMGHCDI